MKVSYLTKEETARLMLAAQQSSNKYLTYLITFLLLTGARRNEALYAKWQDFNLDMMIWTIPLSKSGKAHHPPPLHKAYSHYYGKYLEQIVNIYFHQNQESHLKISIQLGIQPVLKQV